MTCRTGVCQCSNMRCEIPAGPPTVCVCHCRDCQKQADFALSAVAADADPLRPVVARLLDRRF